MSEPALASSPRASTAEIDFYLRQFRSETMVLVVPDPAPADVDAIVPVLARLRANDTRLVVATVRPESFGRLPSVVAADPGLKGAIWSRLRGSDAVTVRLPAETVVSGVAGLRSCLGARKVVWIDRVGGLSGAGLPMLSFVDFEQLGRMVDGFDDPRGAGFLRDMQRLLVQGADSVNLCTASGLADELLTYRGSGTLLTREHYLSFRPLRLDELDSAVALYHQGVDDGFLLGRSDEEIELILSHAFGAFVHDRHLAGMGALLTDPAGPWAELTGLMTVTRFRGEGIAEPLVKSMLEHARELALRHVYACTTSPRAEKFFTRCGFRDVAPPELPASKWVGYDPVRRTSLSCFWIDL